MKKPKEKGRRWTKAEYLRLRLETGAQFMKPNRYEHMERALEIVDAAGPPCSPMYAKAMNDLRECLEDDLGIELIHVLKAGFGSILRYSRH